MSVILTAAQLAAVDRYIDEQHDRFEQVGRRFFEVFRTDRQGKDNVSTQVRSLQQMVTSATRLADVEDFIKNQMGKTSRAAQDWRQVGQDILDALDTLRATPASLPFPAASPEQQLHLRLHLARGWVRAVVAEYLYCKAQAEMESGNV